MTDVRTDDPTIDAALALARARVALKNGPFDTTGHYNSNAMAERTEALREAADALEAMLRASQPQPEHTDLDSHFVWEETEALRTHLLTEHVPTFRADMIAEITSHTHLVTIHQSEHDVMEDDETDPKGYWLHTTFQAPDDESALKIAEAMVKAHPTFLDPQAWDISEGGDWGEIVEREA